jgi:triphosphatase
MGNETELKFEVSPRDLKRLKSARVLHWRDAERSQNEDIRSVYFDTPKHRLKRKGVSLRR